MLILIIYAPKIRLVFNLFSRLYLALIGRKIKESFENPLQPKLFKFSRELINRSVRTDFAKQRNYRSKFLSNLSKPKGKFHQYSRAIQSYQVR